MEGAFPTHFSATYLMLANQPLTLDNPLTLFIRDAFCFISVFITPIVMNIEWDYNYYQPWSDNEWLVDEMLAMLDEDVMMQ